MHPSARRLVSTHDCARVGALLGILFTIGCASDGPQLATSSHDMASDREKGEPESLSTRPSQLANPGADASAGGPTTDPSLVAEDPPQAAKRNAEAFYAYLKERFNRNGLDGNGTIAWLHFADEPENNAQWQYDRNQLIVGKADGVKFLSFAYGLDMMAHELTHGLFDYTTPIDLTWDSGGITESFADVMAVFATAQGDRLDWQIGEGVLTPGQPGDAIRDLVQPHRGYNRTTFANCTYDPGRPFVCGQPNHFREYVPEGGMGSAHLNAGIVSHAAYLLVEGGTEEGITVRGIGPRKAEQIYYRTLIHPLPKSVTFGQFRSIMVSSCTELISQYSITTRDCESVDKAFDAVGIEPTPAPPTKVGIHGRVTLGGRPAQARVRLLGETGVRVVKLLEADTDANGNYFFAREQVAEASAAVARYPMTSYTVTYVNPETTPNGRLAEWHSRTIGVPPSETGPESAIVFPSFDIADVELTGPDDSVPQNTPITFTWTPRSAEREYYAWYSYSGPTELCNERPMQFHSVPNATVTGEETNIVCMLGPLTEATAWRVKIFTRAGEGLSQPRSLRVASP